MWSKIFDDNVLCSLYFEIISKASEKVLGSALIRPLAITSARSPTTSDIASVITCPTPDSVNRFISLPPEIEDVCLRRQLISSIDAPHESREVFNEIRSSKERGAEGDGSNADVPPLSKTKQSVSFVTDDARFRISSAASSPDLSGVGCDAVEERNLFGRGSGI